MIDRYDQVVKLYMLVNIKCGDHLLDLCEAASYHGFETTSTSTVLFITYIQTNTISFRYSSYVKASM